jgi:hypothetical protein
MCIPWPHRPAGPAARSLGDAEVEHGLVEPVVALVVDQVIEVAPVLVSPGVDRGADASPSRNRHLCESTSPV